MTQQKKIVTCLLASILYAAFLALQLRRIFTGRQDEWKIPHSIDDWKNLGIFLKDVTDRRFWAVSWAYMSVYMLLQAFAIPGTIMVTVVGGYLFGLSFGLFYSCLSAAVGSCLCFILSGYLMESTVRKYFGRRIEAWNRTLSREKGNMFSYIIFLRVTPIVPNWFINIASPHLKVPLKTFFIATFFGVAPLCFIYTQGGKILLDIQGTGELFSVWNVLAVALIAVACVLPIVAQKYMGRQIQHDLQEEEELILGSSTVYA